MRPVPGKSGKGRGTRAEDRGRQEAAPGSCPGPAAPHSWRGSWSRLLGQLEALSRGRLLGRGWALGQTFLAAGGCKMLLYLSESLSSTVRQEGAPSLPHWTAELTKCSHSGDSALKREILTRIPALLHPVPRSTRGVPMPRPDTAPYLLPEFRHWLGTRGSWKGRPSTPRDPSTQHPRLTYRNTHCQWRSVG